MSEAILVEEGVEVKVSDLLTLTKDGEKFGLARQTMHHHCNKRNIWTIMIGGTNYTTEAAVQAYIDKRSIAKQKDLIDRLSRLSLEQFEYVLTGVSEEYGNE